MPEQKNRVFLDSNVLYSALYSPAGAPGQILDYFVRGIIQVTVSELVVEEVARAIKSKSPEALPGLQSLLVNLTLEIIADPPIEVSKDRWIILSVSDAVIAEMVFRAKPDYFVTGDKHFFQAPVLKEIGSNVVTPAQMLRILQLR